MNELELEDDILGLIDSTKHVEYMGMEPGIKYTKARLGGKKNWIHYFNFFLVEKNRKGGRIAYTLMDVLGDIGGSLEAITLCLAFLLTPVTYNLT